MAAMAAISIVRIGGLANEIDVLVNDRYQKTVWANNVIDQVNAVARITRNALLTPSQAEAERELGRIPQASAIINENLDRLEKGTTSPDGLALLRDLATTRAAYVRTLGELNTLIRAADNTGAHALLMGEMENAQNAYLGSITALVGYQARLMEAEGRLAGEMAKQSRTLMITLAILA